MRRSSIITSSGLAFLFLAAGGLHSHERDVSGPAVHLYSMTELHANKNGHFIVKASINGNNITVIVDTGATAVALSYKDAEAVGLRPRTLTYDVPVQTANGVGMAARVVLREVEIDTVKVENVQGMVLQDGALKGTLLGMSFLGKLRGFQMEDGKLILKD